MPNDLVDVIGDFAGTAHSGMMASGENGDARYLARQLQREAHENAIGYTRAERWFEDKLIPFTGDRTTMVDGRWRRVGDGLVTLYRLHKEVILDLHLHQWTICVFGPNVNEYVREFTRITEEYESNWLAQLLRRGFPVRDLARNRPALEFIIDLYSNENRKPYFLWMYTLPDWKERLLRGRVNEAFISRAGYTTYRQTEGRGPLPHANPGFSSSQLAWQAMTVMRGITDMYFNDGRHWHGSTPNYFGAEFAALLREQGYTLIQTLDSAKGCAVWQRVTSRYIQPPTMAQVVQQLNEVRDW